MDHHNASHRSSSSAIPTTQPHSQQQQQQQRHPNRFTLLRRPTSKAVSIGILLVVLLATVAYVQLSRRQVKRRSGSSSVSANANAAAGGTSSRSSGDSSDSVEGATGNQKTIKKDNGRKDTTRAAKENHAAAGTHEQQQQQQPFRTRHAALEAAAAALQSLSVSLRHAEAAMDRQLYLLSQQQQQQQQVVAAGGEGGAKDVGDNHHHSSTSALVSGGDTYYFRWPSIGMSVPVLLPPSVPSPCPSVSSSSLGDEEDDIHSSSGGGHQPYRPDEDAARLLPLLSEGASSSHPSSSSASAGVGGVSPKRLLKQLRYLTTYDYYLTNIAAAVSPQSTTISSSNHNNKNRPTATAPVAVVVNPSKHLVGFSGEDNDDKNNPASPSPRPLAAAVYHSYLSSLVTTRKTTTAAASAAAAAANGGANITTTNAAAAATARTIPSSSSFYFFMHPRNRRLRAAVYNHANKNNNNNQWLLPLLRTGPEGSESRSHPGDQKREGGGIRAFHAVTEPAPSSLLLGPLLSWASASSSTSATARKEAEGEGGYAKKHNDNQRYTRKTGRPIDQRQQEAEAAGAEEVDRSIFVSIASYRDDECARTVYDMFYRAKHPRSLFLGIVEQHYNDYQGFNQHGKKQQQQQQPHSQQKKSSGDKETAAAAATDENKEFHYLRDGNNDFSDSPCVPLMWARRGGSNTGAGALAWAGLGHRRHAEQKKRKMDGEEQQNGGEHEHHNQMKAALRDSEAARSRFLQAARLKKKLDLHSDVDHHHVKEHVAGLVGNLNDPNSKQKSPYDRRMEQLEKQRALMNNQQQLKKTKNIQKEEMRAGKKMEMKKKLLGLDVDGDDASKLFTAFKATSKISIDSSGSTSSTSGKKLLGLGPSVYLRMNEKEPQSLQSEEESASWRAAGDTDGDGVQDRVEGEDLVDSVKSSAANKLETTASSSSDCQHVYGFCPLDNLRIRRVAPKHCKGPTFGRYLGFLLYRGERFIFMMDSHNRFVTHWDVLIVSMYTKLQAENTIQQQGKEGQQVQVQQPKVVLSHYPEAWNNPRDDDKYKAYRKARHEELQRQLQLNKEKKQEKQEVSGRAGDVAVSVPLPPPANPPLDQRSTTTYLCRCKYIDHLGYPRLDGIVIAKPKSGKPLPQAFAAAGFLFAHAALIHEVPFDPFLDYVFDGEEILFSVRMWTAGWDIFSPNENTMYHYYYRKGAKRFWGLLPSDWEKRRHVAEHRIQLLMNVTHNYTWTPMYDLGGAVCKHVHAHHTLQKGDAISAGTSASTTISTVDIAVNDIQAMNKKDLQDENLFPADYLEHVWRLWLAAHIEQQSQPNSSSSTAASHLSCDPAAISQFMLVRHNKNNGGEEQQRQQQQQHSEEKNNDDKIQQTLEQDGTNPKHQRRWALRGLPFYGLGSARSLGDYYTFSGLDRYHRRFDERHFCKNA